MFGRRGAASTSSCVAWCMGAGVLDACGSSWARAETSQTVTGWPPSAALACRRISRLPSTYPSGGFTDAPRAHTDPARRARPRRPPVLTVFLGVGGGPLHLRGPRRAGQEVPAAEEGGAAAAPARGPAP